jgi:hypothetical protein
MYARKENLHVYVCSQKNCMCARKRRYGASFMRRCWYACTWLCHVLGIDAHFWIHEEMAVTYDQACLLTNMSCSILYDIRCFFTVFSLALLWYVVRNTFPVMMVRDSLNKQKRALVSLPPSLPPPPLLCPGILFACIPSHPVPIPPLSLHIYLHMHIRCPNYIYVYMYVCFCVYVCI